MNNNNKKALIIPLNYGKEAADEITLGDAGTAIQMLLHYPPLFFLLTHHVIINNKRQKGENIALSQISVNASICTFQFSSRSTANPRDVCGI